MKYFISIAIMAIFLLSALAEAKEDIKYQAFSSDVQVIDVRSDEEWNEGHHPEALHLPHTMILDGGGIEGLDKTKPVVLYCRSGARAERAKNYLESQGFTNVKNLGGISDLIIPTAVLEGKPLKKQN